MTEATNYLQILIPPDECSKHGKGWMFKAPLDASVSYGDETTYPRHEPRKDVWFCVKCLWLHSHRTPQSNDEMYKMRVATLEGEVAGLKWVINELGKRNG